MKNLICAVSLLFCFSFDIQAQPSTKDTLYVWASSGLNMRAEASMQGKKLVTIPFGTALKVEEYVGRGFAVKDELGRLGGYWALVTYKEFKGFVFSGYLNELATPIKGDSDISYFKRVFGPVQVEKTTRHNQYEYEITTEILENAVTITTEKVNPDYAYPTIHLPLLNHRLAHLLARHLYASPSFYGERKPNITFDKKSNLILVEEERDVGCFIRIQLLFSPTGGESGAIVTQYCGC